MKRTSNIVTLIISLAVLLTSCNKEPVEKLKEPVVVAGEGIKLNKEQNVYDLLSTDVKQVISEDTVHYNNYDFPKYEIQLEGNAGEIDQITPGSVVYVPYGDRGGILVYVYEIEGNPGGRTSGPVALTIKAIQATLDMYFNYEDATLDFTTTTNRSKSNSKYENKLVGAPISLGDYELGFVSEFDDTGFKIIMTEDTLLKASFASTLWKEGKSYINVNGSFTLNPTLDFHLKYDPIKENNGTNKGKKLLKWLEAAAVPDVVLAQYKDKNYFLGNLKEIQSTIYTDIDRELNFEMHLEKKLEKEVEIPLGKLNIPSVPVSAEFEMSFVIDFSVFGQLDFEAYAKEKNSVVFGVSLDRDLPEPEWHYELDSKAESGCTLKAEIEIATGIKLVMEAEVYAFGVLGPEITVEPFVEATANIKAITGTDDESSVSWYLDVDAGIRGNATLNLSAYHVDEATWKFWEMVKKEYRKQVYHAPDHLLVDQGNNQTGIAGQTLSNPIVIGAYDSRDKLITYLPVPIHLEPQHGSTDPSGLVWTKKGQASTNWTLGNIYGTQILNAYLKDGGEIIEELTIEANEGNNSNGLIAYYPFSNNANDATGNGHNGTVSGATLATDRFGNANSAYSFDGVDDFIEGTMIQTFQEGTISQWFMTSDPGFQTIVNLSNSGNSSNSFNYYLRTDIGKFNPGSVRFWTQSKYLGPRDAIYTQEKFNDNQWHNLVAVRKSNGAGNLSIYIDGKKITPISIELNESANLDLFINEFVIGANRDHVNRFFKGKIDDVRIYNYALDENEISDLYREGDWTGN